MSPGRFFSGLFNDLRERRLLPVVALLIVALIAVPMLMGGSEEPAPSADPASASVAPPFETDPVVLASEPELRTFKKRLDSFQTRNPFNQYLPKVDEQAQANSASDALPTDTGVTGSTTDPGSLDTGGGSVPPSDTNPVDPTPVDPTPVDPGGGVTLVTTRIDVRVGPVGDTKVLRDVKFLDFLPDKKTPVLEYLQSDFDLSNAVFIVSPFVLSSEGDGKCAPTPQDCQFVQLQKGDTHAFQYDDGERYTLTLLDVNLHEEPIEQGAPEATGRQPDFATQSPAGKVIGG